MVSARSICVGLGVLWTGFAHAGDINTTFFGNLAIDGYDPVAYHTTGVPTLGKEEFTYVWEGANWRFSSEQTLEAFKEEPEAYAPQYGGHCANGMSLGHKVGANPELFRVIDDKLYLYFAPRGRERWESGTDQWIPDANTNWVILRSE